MMFANNLIPVNPATQFEYGETVRSTNPQPLATPANAGLLELLAQAGLAGMGKEDMDRMRKSGMDPFNPADRARYEQAMGSLSGRIGNLGDRIANVPQRIMDGGKEAKDKITSLFDLFGGKD